MSNEELDRYIAEAGFDDAVDDSSCWPRHEVWRASSDLDRDDSRFCGTDGDLKTESF